jgi:hypothetical protein
MMSDKNKEAIKSYVDEVIAEALDVKPVEEKRTLTERSARKDKEVYKESQTNLERKVGSKLSADSPPKAKEEPKKTMGTMIQRGPDDAELAKLRAMGADLSKMPIEQKAVYAQSWLNFLKIQNEAEDVVAQRIMKSIAAHYGMNGQEQVMNNYQALDRNTRVGQIQQFRGQMLGQEAFQLETPQMPPQAAAIASQMALGFVGDLFASMGGAGRKAPSQTVSATLAGQAATGFEATKKNYAAIAERVAIKNADLINANMDRKVKILKSMDATERAMLTQATNVYKAESMEVGKLVNNLRAVYGKESELALRAQQINADNAIRRVTAAASMMNAMLNLRKANERLREKNLGKVLDPKDMPKIMARAELLGIRPSMFSNAALTLSNNSDVIPYAMEPAAWYHNKIMNKVKEIKKGAKLGFFDWRRYFLSEKEQKDLITDEVSDFLNLIGTPLGAGMAVDLDAYQGFSGDADINLDTFSIIAKNPKDAQALDRALRTNRFSKDPVKSSMLESKVNFELIQKHLAMGENSDISPELVKKAYNYLVANQIVYANRNQAAAASLALIQAGRDLGISLGDDLTRKMKYKMREAGEDVKIDEEEETTVGQEFGQAIMLGPTYPVKKVGETLLGVDPIAESIKKRGKE